MKKAVRETVVGAVAVGVLGLAVLRVVSTGDVTPAGTYPLEAAFGKVDGLAVGSEVRLSGVAVGRVTDQRLDENFRAVLTLSINESLNGEDLKIPVDSAAVVQTDGLFGTKFVVISPGGADESLKPGDRFRNTQDAVIVEELLDLIIAEGKAQQARTKEQKNEPEEVRRIRGHSGSADGRPEQATDGGTYNEQ